MGCSSTKPLPDDTTTPPKYTDGPARAGDFVEAENKPQPPPVTRGLTSRSIAMVETLEGLELELTDMQTKSDAAETALADATTADALPLGLRSELASLHGSANKLLATRLDAIVTADLTTGRDEARAKRKELVALAESLIELTEQQIKRIDALKAGEPAAAVEATAEANAPATAFEQLVGPRKVW